MAGRKLGVMYAQSGPGVTNAVTGVAAAFMDSVPLLLLATQAPSNLYGRDAHQEVSGATYGIDQLDMFLERVGGAVSAADRGHDHPLLATIVRGRAGPSLDGGDRSCGGSVGASIEHDDLAPAQYRTDSRRRSTSQGSRRSHGCYARRSRR